MLPELNNSRRTCNRVWIVMLLLVSSLLSSCLGGGGGGDDVDVTDDSVPPIPSHVKYYAGGHGGDPGSAGMTLLVDDTITVYATFRLEGNYTPTTKQFSLTQSTIPSVAMSSVSGLGFDLPIIDSSNGQFGLRVDETLQWRFGLEPTSGIFVVTAGNYIQVAVNNDVDGGGTPGVDVKLVEFGVTEASASLTWAQFISALNNIAAPDYQRQASLAYLVLQRLYQPVQGVMQNFSTVAQQESALEAAGTGNAITVPLCSMLNSSTGVFNLTWIDVAGEIAGVVGPDDNFIIGVDNCWMDDPATSNDLLYSSGQLQLNGYRESTTPFYLANSDVLIDNLLLTQTEDVGGGVINTGSKTLFNTFSTEADYNGFIVELTADVSGTVNLDNTLQIAEATAAAMTLPSEVGNFAVNLLADAISSGMQTDTVACPLSGSFDYALSSGTMAFNTGSTMNVTFNNCEQGSSGDSTTLNGSYTLTATSYAGTDNLGFTLVINDFTSLDDVGLRSIAGQMHFARTVNSGTSNEVSASVAGQSLNVTESGVSASLSNFEFSGSRTLSGVSLGVPGETFTLQLSTLSDVLDGAIISTFSGPEMLDLQAGSARVTAPDSSNLLLTITDTSGTVSLDLDSDGNGSAEDTITTNWSELY
jgi:hypothetical protein